VFVLISLHIVWSEIGQPCHDGNGCFIIMWALFVCSTFGVHRTDLQFPAPGAASRWTGPPGPRRLNCLVQPRLDVSYFWPEGFNSYRIASCSTPAPAVGRCAVARLLNVATRASCPATRFLCFYGMLLCSTKCVYQYKENYVTLEPVEPFTRWGLVPIHGPKISYKYLGFFINVSLDFST
jgi:hypothetical protein